jgi:protease I
MRAVIITDQGVQDEEYIYPYYRLQEAGIQTISATKNGKPCCGKYGIPVNVVASTMDLSVEEYDIVIIPGGWEAPERVRQDEYVMTFLRSMNSMGKIIGAICHGPAVLISAGIVKGKTMTCYKGMKDDLMNAGAIYVDSSVVVHGNIVTAPHYRNCPDFMMAVLATFEGRKHLSELVLA